MQYGCRSSNSDASGCVPTAVLDAAVREPVLPVLFQVQTSLVLQPGSPQPGALPLIAICSAGSLFFSQHWSVHRTSCIPVEFMGWIGNSQHGVVPDNTVDMVVAYVFWPDAGSCHYLAVQAVLVTKF